MTDKEKKDPFSKQSGLKLDIVDKDKESDKRDDKRDDKKASNRYAIFSEDKNSIHSSNTVIIKYFEQFYPLSIYNC